MLALCSMLSDTYYAHNYASIIGGSLTMSKSRDTHNTHIIKPDKCDYLFLIPTHILLNPTTSNYIIVAITNHVHMNFDAEKAGYLFTTKKHHRKVAIRIRL